MPDGSKTHSGLQSKDSSGDLKADFEQLREDFKNIKHDLAALAGNQASNAKENLKDGLATVEDRAKVAMESASTELQEIQRQAEKAVKKKPLTAVAAALAIGYFIGGISRK